MSLNINDTNQYMARLFAQGGTPGQYNYIFTKLIVTKRVLISSPGPLTREVGQDVVFVVNSTAMSEATWGVRLGDTNDLKITFDRVFNPGGAFPDTKINSTSYAGRVSFVGDLTKGQAWFKITNLNINDTNNYMAKIRVRGTSFYKYIPAQLTVIKPPVTTEPLKTSTKELTTGVSSSQTSPRPTTSQVPQLSNRSMSINVVKDVVGDFSDSNSAAFKQFSENFVSEINSVYKNIHIFEKAKVTSLSENIIPVKFVVYFKSTIKPDEICGPLKDAVKDNRLGSLKIVPGSLGCSNDPNTSFPKKQSNSASTCTSIIVACVTVNIFLILVVVFLLIYIWRLRLNTEKRAGIRNSSSIQDKNPEANENVHPMEDTSQGMTTKTARTPNAEKELYETINENRVKNNVAIATTVKHTSGPSVGVQGDAPSFPQHYQELQRKAPNPTPLYEPLKQQGVSNKEELASEGPKTYEQLQQSASGREYQSLKSHKDTESKV
ncbi:uncharacterized protein LOC116292038 isoform X2 [Actinia tenebrosa]|uniref:Uncharacterized protein LOC116292038 isoform X2 n=1 Tax=Actinia tenebrosa TaxID=6105 RepID=A0A6P8HH14_ACTTE|nr:uncharacterized protein LOC116292038 isoform X2 [Actinia tenebrosa]